MIGWGTPGLECGVARTPTGSDGNGDDDSEARSTKRRLKLCSSPVHASATWSAPLLSETSPMSSRQLRPSSSDANTICSTLLVWLRTDSLTGS